MDSLQVQLLMTELYTAHNAYMIKLVNKERLGKQVTKFKFKGVILTAMLEIMIDYLNPANDTEENLFTIVDFEDVLQHFNNIANTNIYNKSIIGE